jgi:hypothetical protein
MNDEKKEAVAWIAVGENKNVFFDLDTALSIDANPIPLYTTPQTKPLSDDEILIEAKYQPNLGYYLACEFDVLEFARAIEAKVRGEK